ncbi:MAG: hypothetical protein WDN06_01580 [Asticcacaulis sp.]
MAGFFSNLRNVIIVSLILAAIFMAGFGLHGPDGFGMIFATAVVRWAHVVCGIMWIGLLYYFNFVQIRVMPEVPAELKPGVTKYVAPEALFWFRWAAFFHRRLRPPPRLAARLRRQGAEPGLRRRLRSAL